MAKNYDLDSFGGRLKYIRKEKHKMSQGEMAEKIGITQPAYGRIENGISNPSFENLEKIREVFAKDWFWILTNAVALSDINEEMDEMKYISVIESLRKENEKLKRLLAERDLYILDLEEERNGAL